MAKKKGLDRARGNGGYSKAGQFIRLKHKIDLNLDAGWMEDLPGGTWRDPGVLRAYMRAQFERAK